MPQTAAPLALTDDDRAELARWSQGGSPMLAERAEIVLACAEPGSGVARVAGHLGLSRMTVRRWRRRFAEAGRAAGGPAGQGGGGHHRHLGGNPRYRDALVTVVDGGPQRAVAIDDRADLAAL